MPLPSPNPHPTGSTWLLLLLLTGGLGLLTTGCQKTEYPLIEQKCGTCHSAEVVYQQRFSQQRWQQVLHGMKAVGLKVTRQEEERILEILLQHFSNR